MKPICTDGNDFEALRKAGQTYVELESNFDEHLHVHAEKMRLAYADYRAALKRWFNGYRFAQERGQSELHPRPQTGVPETGGSVSRWIC